MNYAGQVYSMSLTETQLFSDGHIRGIADALLLYPDLGGFVFNVTSYSGSLRANNFVVDNSPQGVYVAQIETPASCYRDNMHPTLSLREAVDAIVRDLAEKYYKHCNVH